MAETLMIADHHPSSLSFDARFNGTREAVTDPRCPYLPYLRNRQQGKESARRMRSTKTGRLALTSASLSEPGNGLTNPAGTDKASAITALMMGHEEGATHDISEYDAPTYIQSSRPANRPSLPGRHLMQAKVLCNNN